jgi:hypothetical protein
MRTAPVGAVSDHRAENGTTKCPESLCLMLALPLSGRRVPPPARSLLPGHGSYRLIRQSRSALPSFGLSLVRRVSAGCCQPLLPAGVPGQDSESLLCRAQTESSRSELWAKSPLMPSSCIVASSGSIRTRTLCWPERTGIISDKLPCTESVGIKPNLFFVEPATLPE